MSTEATQIFIKDLPISFKPKSPFLRLKVIKSNKVPTMAAILVARARSPMLRYLDNTRFKMVLMITAMVALIIECLIRHRRLLIRCLLVQKRSCLWNGRIGRWLSCLWLLVFFLCLCTRSIEPIGFQFRILIDLWFRFIIFFFRLVPRSSVDHAVLIPIKI